MIAPARSAAYHIGLAVSVGRLDLPAAIAQYREPLRDVRDRALASEIATGVQRSRAALDHLIVSYSKRGIERLDAEIVEVLRLSIYQLLHLTRVPAAAVVNDAVKLAGRERKRSAAGLVNAVLRAVSSGQPLSLLPPRPADPLDQEAVLDYFSITLSHPRWLAARWYRRLGFEIAERWMLFNNAAAPLTLRANRLRYTRDEVAAQLREAGVQTVEGHYGPDALVVTEGHPLRAPGAEAGWFVVQDEASQLVTLLAGEHPGRLVLDTCASPGGKTTALAAAARDALIVACDVRDRRIDLLRRTVNAAGATNVRLVQADAAMPLPFATRFDCVLVDAPCSGLGTLRRDPDIRWRRREEDLATLAAAQQQLLRSAGEAVRPGGRLVYATCSSEPEENEEVVETWLQTQPGFVPVHASHAHPQLPSSVVDARGHLRTAPHLHNLEAFFGAVLVRQAQA